ncbi:MAG: hypothetical protein PHO01_03075 [Desulfotomaculaceae bacterium]|nr:hypothetical protein [Desulfotomaculaceae bacterium]
MNMLRGLVQNAEIVAIGMKSHKILTRFGIKHYPVRHPANGGANDYRRQIADLLT